MSDSTNDRTTSGSQTPTLSNTMYDRLKYVALVLLPAFSALYFGLGQIWGFPKIEEVIGTVAVLDTVLGMLIRKSNQEYKNSDERFDGSIDAVDDEGDKIYEVKVDGNPDEVLEEKSEVTLKVNSDVPTVIAETVVEEDKPKPKKRTPRKRT